MEPMPSSIYVWLVRSEEMLDQPGSWRIRKWDIEPFPEANFVVPSETARSTADQCNRAMVFKEEWTHTAPIDIEPWYSHWVGELTAQGLHAKTDIATVLAILSTRLAK